MGCSTFSEYTVLPEVSLAKIPKEAPLDVFITHNMPLEDINKAFELMHEGKSIRTVIHF